MNKLEFIRALDAGSTRVSDKTADLWFHILAWVQKQGYADTADTPEFIDYVRAFRRIEVATIGRHLSRMAEAGFLDEHSLKRGLSSEAKEVINTSLHGLLFGGGASALATTMKRYTLPGAPCPRVFKAGDALLERNRLRDDEMREHLSRRSGFGYDSSAEST